MPGAPELEVVKDYLNDRIAGVEVAAVAVLKPSVLRSLAANIVEDMPGRSFGVVERRGKFLTFNLSGDRLVIVNPMLTGCFQHCSPATRVYKRTCLVFTLSSGLDLRYVDETQMGRVYYAAPDQIDGIPQYGDLGPDVLDGDVSFLEFKALLKPFHGEIKGILTRGKVYSGIGNAYADEILFAARIYPFTKKRDLSEDDLRNLWSACRDVIVAATAVVRERMGERTHEKHRDFLQVHNKGGQPCPRCGHTISQVTANQRITSYCRQCQPGMLTRN